MLRVTNSNKSIQCRLNLPLSKSIINRLLVIRHLSGGENPGSLVSESSDTAVMQELLDVISQAAGGTETLTELNVGNAGTVMRFLAAVLSVTPGLWLLTGTERMQQRPVKPLTDALQSLGADISFLNKPGYPPLLIKGNSQLKGGKVELYAGISSQFISALMMLAPKLEGGLKLELQGEIISASYIRMTQALMQKTGAGVSFSGNQLLIREGQYTDFDFNELSEPDWSAAAFWYELAAFATEAQILLKDLKKDSVQGDAVLPDIYASLGVSSAFTGEGLLLTKTYRETVAEFNYDFTECPDLAQAVIVSCAGLGIKGRYSGLKTLRVKETDRIEALRNELTKLGYGVEVCGNEISLVGTTSSATQADDQPVVNCYDDHRMAMAFAPLALLHHSICLDDPEVVKKSYPAFWKDVAAAGFKLGDEK